MLIATQYGLVNLSFYCNHLATILKYQKQYIIKNKMVFKIMNKLSKIFSKYKLIILIPLFVILFLILAFWLYEGHTRYYITAKFAESGPLYKNMPVYYKGYKIGRIENVRIRGDYKYTLAKIVFYPRKPKLSDNIVAKAKKLEMEDDYVDLIYPDPPSDTPLKSGGVIEGRGAFDMDSLLSDVADAEILEPLLEHFSDLLVSANQTSNEIRNFFADSRLILKDNRQNIRQTTVNLALSTKSLKKMTSKFNNSVTEDKLNNTVSNVGKSSTNILAATESIKNITASIDCATRNLDKTVAKIDSTVSNARTITRGICESLSKRFAGLRIIFGRPINKNKCPQKCSK